MRRAASIACLSACLGITAMAVPPHDAERRPHPVPDPKPETEAIPRDYSEAKKIAILLEKLEQQEAFLGMQITLRIINPTDQAMVYAGAYASSPDIKRQTWKGGRWTDVQKEIKPGFNPSPITIPPGQSVVFVMGVTAEQMPMRVGLDYTLAKGKAQFTVWSDKIER